MEQRDQKALGLMAFAITTTRPRTAEEAEACNARFARARDFLLRASARPAVTPAGPLTAAEMEELRPAALRNLRATCASCGLCAHFGVLPP